MHSITNCKIEINNTDVHTHDINVVMSMFNLIEYSDAYSKTLGSYWRYYRDVLALNDNGNIIDFSNDNNNNISFKQQITVQTLDNGTKGVETKVPLKYLSNFCRTLEISLINCEISFTLTWSKNCFLLNGTAANQELTFTISNTKFYFPVVTLSTQHNLKPLKQLESGFKGTNNRNKYQSRFTKQVWYLTDESWCITDFLIDPSFEEVNRRFFLSFKDSRVRESYKQSFLLTVEMKDCNVLFDGRNFFDQQVKKDLGAYDNIPKIATGKSDDSATGCLLDYLYF